MSQALQEVRATIRINGTLRPAGEVRAGSLFTLAGDGSAGLPARGSAMVEGTINGFPFRAPVDPDREGSSLIRFSEALQTAAGVQAGDTVTVEITRVDEEEEIRVPADLMEALAAAPLAQSLWNEITPMSRREWIRWVASAKQEETRARRIENGMDMLVQGKRRPCCFPGVNWVTKDLVSPEETWIPLPSAKGSASSASRK